MKKFNLGNPASSISRNLVLFCILLISFLLISKLLFLLSAFLGAITLYILFRRVHKYLVYRYRLKRLTVTIILMIISLIVILIPLYFIGVFITNKIEPLFMNTDPIVHNLQRINAFINQYIEFSIISPGNIQKLGQIAETVVPSILDSGINLITNLVMMYFFLWFMLNNSFNMERWLKINSPFSRNNTRKVFEHIKSNVLSNAYGIIILGIIQGIIAMIGYLIFGVEEAVLWGLITAAASVIPFVGTMLAWVPLSILLMANGDMFNGIGLFLYGLLIVGSSDNVFRFLLQKKMASTHPIITVLGVIVGLSLFGFWGLIFGPLLISLTLLISKIYKEEISIN